MQLRQRPLLAASPVWADEGGCLLQQEHATETEETCTQYNMLKIARYLFRWTGAPAFADYYERAILNGDTLATFGS